MISRLSSLMRMAAAPCEMSAVSLSISLRGGMFLKVLYAARQRRVSRQFLTEFELELGTPLTIRHVANCQLGSATTFTHN